MMSPPPLSYHHQRFHLITTLCLVATSLSFTASLPVQNGQKAFQRHSKTIHASPIPNSTVENSAFRSHLTGKWQLNASDSEKELENEEDEAMLYKISGGAPPPPPQPTLQQLFKFALPCLGLWISGPLLSLVDTASVGLTALPGEGAAQLGALGPATTFIDGATYLFAFLNVATTNLYASALAKNPNDPEAAKAAGDAVARTAVKNSLICGFFLLFLLLSQGEKLLSIYIGPSAANVVKPASKYVNIRAFSMPTSLMAGVIQSSLLGAKDSVTPLIAVFVSTIVNVIGDITCVVGLGMGTTGAAIATLLAQWAGTLAILRPAQKKLFVPKSEQSSQNKVTSKSFLAFAAPVLTLIIGKIAAFGVMTHVAASLPVEASLASHQIILSLFFFVSPFLEVISQTAQTFLPQYYIGAEGEKYGQVYGQEAQALAGRLLRLGVTVGAGIAFFAASIPKFFPFFLTNDAAVQSAVRPLALPLFLGSLLTAPVAVSEGVLLARRELKFLAGVYLFSTALFPFGLFKIKKAAGPVGHVWFGFVFFQLFRALCFTGKLWGTQLVSNLMKRGKGEGNNGTSEISVA